MVYNVFGDVMIIKVLMENTACSEEFICEHGLSLYIETNGKKILFDTGQSGEFATNAEKLGVDLAEIDFAVISHGHYDHGGGIAKFLQINKKAPVYINKHGFEPHYNGTEKYIGLDTELLDNPQIILVENIDLAHNIKLFSCNNKKLAEPINASGLNMQIDGDLAPEDFRHEQYMQVIEGDKKILISGCSHKGIVNIMNWTKPDVLVGGFHFMKLDVQGDGKEYLDNSVKELMSYNCKYYTCHCTGIEQYDYLKTEMGDRLCYISTGEIFEVWKLKYLLNIKIYDYWHLL